MEWVGEADAVDVDPGGIRIDLRCNLCECPVVSGLEVSEESRAIDDEDPPVPGEAADVFTHDGGNAGVDHGYPGVLPLEVLDHLRKAGLCAEDDLVLTEERPVDGSLDEGRRV